MTPAGNICRVCLAIDAPVLNIAGSSLQDVYQKLTEISMNTLRQPVVACYLCYSQLRKCQVLMMRSVRANKVLTQMLQDSEIKEQEFVAVVKQYQLDDGLCVTPIELISITGTDYSLIKEEIKEGRLSSQCRGEMETDILPLAECFRFEGSEHEETIERPALEDIYDTECGELISEGNVKHEASHGAVDIEKQELITEENIKNGLEKMEDICTAVVVIHEENTMQRESEGAQVIEDMKSEGAAPAEECRETHAGKIQDGRALPSDGKNILEKRRIRRTVVQEDVNKRSSSYTLRNAKPANVSQVLTDTSMYHDNVIKHNDVLKSKSILYTGKKQFKRGESIDRFIKGDRLKIHLVTHAAEKPFQCDMCKNRFSNKASLKIHLMIHTGQKLFQCDICKVRFRLKAHLKGHLMMHTGQKPLECEICKVRCTDKSSLKAHSMIHTGQKPFECEICNVRFSRKGDFNRHLRTHTSLKSFECEICKVRFTRKAHLKRHSVTHTGQKPFECNICNLRFTRKYTVKRHLITHTGQKPFECDLCKSRFSQKGSLQKHLKRHVSERRRVER